MANYVWRTLTTLSVVMLTTIALVNPTTQRYGDSRYVSRKNFGYVLQRVSSLQLVTGRLRLLFKYEIPTMYAPRPMEDLRCSEFNHSHSARRSCLLFRLFRGVVISLFQLKNDMVRLLGTRWEEINDLLEDLNQPGQNRKERGLASWFGLASKEDVTKLQANMIAVLKSNQRALESWSRGQSLVSKVINISQNRFKNIERMLNITRSSII